MLLGGDDSGLFRMPAMTVTSAAVGVLDLVHTQLEAACAVQEPLAARSAFLGARDVLDLFRTLAPAALTAASAIASDPPPTRDTALLHNDCAFLAHSLLTLTVRYRTRLPADLQGVTFVDMVPAFHEAGDVHLNTLLQSLMARAQSLFGDARTVAEAGDAKALPQAVTTSVTRACQHLMQVCLSCCVDTNGAVFILMAVVGETSVAAVVACWHVRRCTWSNRQCRSSSGRDRCL